MGIDFDKGLNISEQVIGTGKNLAALAGLIDPDDVVIQRPKGIRVPHANFIDALWFELKPLRLTKQTKAARGANAIQTSDKAQSGSIAALQAQNTGKPSFPTFKFLAPNEIQEMLNHDWSPFESIVTRLLQKGVDLTRLFSDVKTVVDPTVLEFKKLLTTDLKDISVASIKRQLHNVVAGMTASNVPRAKLDTPLVYQDSNRRVYTLAFNLVDEGNSYKDVVWPVQQLAKYAAPQYSDGDQIKFDPPFVFEVTTVPGTKFIKMKHAALTSIQPIYRQPYRDGYPTSCELNLTFTEIEPHYRRIWEDQGKGTVTVSITPGIRASFGDKQDLSIAGISTRKYVDKLNMDLTQFPPSVYGATD